jgi:hypothetical protein
VNNRAVVWGGLNQCVMRHIVCKWWGARYRTSVHSRVQVLVSALKPILVLNEYVPYEYSSNSQVYEYSILASISIYSQVFSMILMNIIPLYRYIDLKYMIHAIYMIGLGQ